MFSQIQMEKLASRHAISELFNWISLMENVIDEDEENLKSAVGSNVIQDYLQKYKVEDFIQNFSNLWHFWFCSQIVWCEAVMWELHAFL